MVRLSDLLLPSSITAIKQRPTFTMAVRPRPKIRALLIDISGTLMIGSTPTQEAVQALAELRRSKFPFRFCSNTSKESTSVLQKRMLDAGFDVQTGESQELWTSLKAVRSLIRSRGLKRSAIQIFSNMGYIKLKPFQGRISCCPSPLKTNAFPEDCTIIVPPMTR